MNYKNIFPMNEENMDAYQKRVSAYYESAKNEKQLDEKNPLKLK